MNKIYLTAFTIFSANILTANAYAHDVAADDHAPIGVMADHVHKKGEVMLSLRYMHMDMDGNQIGTDSVTPEEIVSNTPNRFFGLPGQPPNLRIVPINMRTDMIMAGAMYAPSDAVTLMVMGSYVEKEMEHVTFQGGMGTSRLGNFTTQSKGIGDIKVAALFPLLGIPDTKNASYDSITAKAGISIPTGSTSETDQILAPNGATPIVRLPYPMQIGSGSFDLEPAMTYKGQRGKMGFGAQVAAKIRLERNSNDYSFGDVYEGGAWLSYRAAPWISLSGRMRYRSTGQIRGIDAQIIGPVQTADPDFQGGERLDLLGGVNLVSTHGSLVGHRLALELGVPVYQDLNGPQLRGRWNLNIGWQKAF